MCDIEQMFHSFHVGPEHRDFLQFLWYENNTPGRRTIEYRINVHGFVRHNFYVHNGLASRPATKEAIDLVTATRAMLATANLKLHKVISNSGEVMEAFPAKDRGKGV